MFPSIAMPQNIEILVFETQHHWESCCSSSFATMVTKWIMNNTQFQCAWVEYCPRPINPGTCFRITVCAWKSRSMCQETSQTQPMIRPCEAFTWSCDVPLSWLEKESLIIAVNNLSTHQKRSSHLIFLSHLLQGLSSHSHLHSLPAEVEMLVEVAGTPTMPIAVSMGEGRQTRPGGTRRICEIYHLQ